MATRKKAAKSSSSKRKAARRPWDYFRDHFWVTYWFESVGPKLLLETNAVKLYNLPF